MLVARFDGGCDDNPGGNTACSCIVHRAGVEVYRYSKYLGFGPLMSNNVAEFEGLHAILKWYLNSGLTEKMDVIGDSQIVIGRMTGMYRKPAKGLCAEIAKKCLELQSWLPCDTVRFFWEPRLHNDDCDAMCNAEIESGKGVMA